MNSLFIGLGGAGCYAVAEFEQKVRNHGNNSNNKYIYLDTDGGICERYPFIKNSGDFIGLGGSSKQKGHSIQNIINDSVDILTNKDKTEVEKRRHLRFLQWYDTNIVSNEELTKGAEGIRMMSRTMLFAHYEKIEGALEPKMHYTDPNDNVDKPRKIYLVSGTCGGTGSGCVIDILYMLANISKKLDFAATELPVNLLLVMPQGYIKNIQNNSSLYTSYRTNAYAIVDEINALLKDYYGYYNEDTDHVPIKDSEDNIIGYNYVITNKKAGLRMNNHDCRGEAKPFQFNVFQNAFLFDSVTPQGYNMTHEQRSENVANFLFALEVGTQANATLDSNISNHVRPEKYLSGGNEFVKAFAATGMYVAQSWEELTRKYVRDKFLYQMLRYGFVGSDVNLSAEQLTNDIDDFTGKIKGIIKEEKNQAGTGINDLLAQILGGLGYDAIGTVMQNIKDSTSSKKPNLVSMFADVDSNAKNDVKAIATVVDNLLEKVKTETLSICSDWVKKYNLSHALQLAKKLDGVCDELFKNKINNINHEPIERYKINREKKRRKDCEKLFDQYIDYLVYRNLSNEEEGYLDECKQRLAAAIKFIGFDEHKKDGKLVNEWELDYVKYLNTLSIDRARSVWPSLDRLYNKDNGCLVKDNEVERDYASLVSQTEAGNDPDLTYDLNKSKLLYTFKHECFKSIEKNNGKWKDYFDMSVSQDAFVTNMEVAFETYEKEVDSVGLELSNSSILKKAFSQLVLSNEDQNRIIQTMDGFDEVNLAGAYHTQGQPHIEIYVGDFRSMAWLNNGLFPNGNNSTDKTPVQDNTMDDRVFKLYVEFGHPLNVYRYFNDVYKPYFETFHAEALRNPKKRHHQPFIDKRFFELGNVYAYFEQTNKEEEVKALNQKLNGHKDTFLKFCAWFLCQTLKDHEKEGLLAAKGMTSKKYYKVESVSKGKSKTKKESVFFGMTNEFDSWPAKKSYDPSGEEYRIEMERDYKDSEVKTFSKCFDLWLRILQNATMKPELDPDKLVEAFDEARNKLNDATNESLSDFLNYLDATYVHLKSDGNRRVYWEQMFGDFLKVFPMKKK